MESVRVLVDPSSGVEWGVFFGILLELVRVEIAASPDRRSGPGRGDWADRSVGYVTGGLARVPSGIKILLRSDQIRGIHAGQPAGILLDWSATAQGTSRRRSKSAARIRDP